MSPTRLSRCITPCTTTAGRDRIQKDTLATLMIHGRFESRYVDLIEVTAPDVVKYMRKERGIWTMFGKRCWTIRSKRGIRSEEVYRLDLPAAFRRRMISMPGSWFTSVSPPEPDSCGIWHTPHGPKAPSRYRAPKPSTSRKIPIIRDTILPPARPPRSDLSRCRYRLALARSPPGFTAVASSETPRSPNPARTPCAS